MTETEYITYYVQFLKAKRALRENLRENLTTLELNFLEIQSEAILQDIDIKSVQAAVNELRKQQKKNKTQTIKETKVIGEILKDYIEEFGDSESEKDA